MSRASSRKPGNKIVPTGSMCFKGLKRTRQSRYAVSSPKRWATKPCAASLDREGLSTPLAAAADREMTEEYSTCLEKSDGLTIEMINCILAETRRQDARLNENYKRLISKLATEGKNALVEAQRAWINFGMPIAAFTLIRKAAPPQE
jgi:Lysozyme inhibitor LprI